MYTYDEDMNLGRVRATRNIEVLGLALTVPGRARQFWYGQPLEALDEKEHVGFSDFFSQCGT